MKKMLSILITLFLCIAMSSVAYAVEYGEELKNQPTKNYTQAFSDVPESFWAFEYIAEMAERGVLSGYPDGKFYPNSQVTRAEFAKIMTSAAGVAIEEPHTQLFSDVNVDDWYTPYIYAAIDYLSGYNQNGSLYYMPNSPALREDIAVAMVKLKGYSILGADLTSLSRMFSDYQSISSDAQKYVASAIENSLISGYEDGTFRGQSGITRAEVATLLWRAYQYGNENKIYDTSTAMSATSADTQGTAYQSENSDAQQSATTDVKSTITNTQETKKTYVMKKLSAANVTDINKMTYDGNDNIFYLDSSDNCIYRVNVSNGNNTKHMTVTNLVLEKGDGASKENIIAEYSSYVPVQVFYDTVNDKLLLIGYYENVSEPFSSPRSNQKYTVAYDITDGNANLYCDIGGNEALIFQAVLNKDTVIVKDMTDRENSVQDYDNVFMLDITSGYLEYIRMKGNNLSYIKGGSDLYGYSYWKDNGYYIFKYDFSSDMYDIASKKMDYKTLGIKDDYYYFWDMYDGIFKLSVTTGKSTMLDISTSSEDTVFEDMGNMSSISRRFFVVDDDTMIFYDTAMSAFRILTKNI